MKYAVIQCVNTNFTVVSEWGTQEGAIKSWHSTCQALWNDQATLKACVMIVDENLDVLPGYKEFISHSAA